MIDSLLVARDSEDILLYRSRRPDLGGRSEDLSPSIPDIFVVVVLGRIRFERDTNAGFPG